jgi:hypothetical protein
MNNSKRHHHIPVFLQKGFLVDNLNVRVFDKEKQSFFETTPNNVFVHQHYNSVGKNSFEDLYTRMDTMVAPIIENIRNTKDLNIPYRDHAILCTFVAMMMFRPESTRNSITDLSDWIAKIFSAYTKEDAKIPSDFPKKVHIDLSTSSETLEELGQMIWDKKVMLIERAVGYFCLGDHVISTFNDKKYDCGIPMMGVGCEGIRIHFPISKTLCLIFRDPKICDGMVDPGVHPDLINKLQFNLASRFVLIQKE